jgi:hypothetical protein
MPVGEDADARQGMATIEVETINADLPIKGEKNARHRSSGSDAERCGYPSIQPRARRISREGITKK